jgi:hypothetical protein
MKRDKKRKGALADPEGMLRGTAHSRIQIIPLKENNMFGINNARWP